MKKIASIALILALLPVALAACAPAQPGSPPSAQPSAATQPPATAATSTAAGTGQPSATAASGKPVPAATLALSSARPEELVEAAGVVKQVKQGLVLITTASGMDFMLRLSGNTKWDEGVDTEILVGNTVACLVKPEPTFTTPSQGEVYRVMSNKKL